jgi:hypothetical protein
MNFFRLTITANKGEPNSNHYDEAPEVMWTRNSRLPFGPRRGEATIPLLLKPDCRTNDSILAIAFSCSVHHSASPDVSAGKLKLRFYERNNRHLCGKEFGDRRQQGCEGNKRYIHDRQVNLIAMEVCRSNISGIEAFEDNHPRVLPDFPGQLAIGNIDGMNLPGLVLQEAIGKASGRCTYIKTGETGGGNMELAECLFEFQAASRNVAAFRLDADRDAGGVPSSWFIGQLIIEIYFSCINHCPGSFQGGGKLPVD